MFSALPGLHTMAMSASQPDTMLGMQPGQSCACLYPADAAPAASSMLLRLTTLLFPPQDLCSFPPMGMVLYLSSAMSHAFLLLLSPSMFITAAPLVLRAEGDSRTPELGG